MVTEAVATQYTQTNKNTYCILGIQQEFHILVFMGNLRTKLNKSFNITTNAKGLNHTAIEPANRQYDAGT